MKARRRVIALAAEQFGVVSVAQATAQGLPRSSFHDLARGEGWRALHRGVYLLPGASDGLRQSAMAALLAVGDQAVLCRRTAAALLGLLPEPPVVEVFLPADQVSTGLRGVRICRTRTLRARDVTTVDGLRVTTAPRTIIDLAAVLEPPDLRAALIEARRRRLVTLERVERRLADIGPLRGVGVLRRMLWELRPEHCDSILEQRVRVLLRQWEIEPPHPKPWPVDVGIRTLHVDIAWPGRRLGIEADGLSFHGDAQSLDIDHRRGNLLTLAGWRILHIGWARLERDPEGFIRELRALMK